MTKRWQIVNDVSSVLLPYSRLPNHAHGASPDYLGGKQIITPAFFSNVNYSIARPFSSSSA